MTVEQPFRDFLREVYSERLTLSISYYTNNFIFLMHRMLTLKMSISNLCIKKAVFVYSVILRWCLL